jgi:hypothetical protein
VRVNIQNAFDEAAQVAALHRAGLVFDRLDQVCGERWYPAFDELPAALIPPPSTATASSGAASRLRPLPAELCEVTREDVGEGATPRLHSPTR